MYFLVNINSENYRILMSASTNRIATKYILGSKIGSGSFGQVYAVNLIGTSEIYALKREDQKSKNSQIVIEYKVLNQMSGVRGFANVHWQGTENKFNILVMDMLGPSLEDLFQICGKSFSLKTTLMIADQMIERVEELHNQNYIHRDIKPENYLMGISKSSHIVHLIDFGLSKKYRDSKTMQHIPYKQNKNLTGTARYASINAHLGIQQSRRDDLQSIGYVIIYLRQGYLPWQGIKANNKNEKYQKIMEKKMSIPVEIQCRGLPRQISTFINYCRSLKFNQKPDYNYLRRILRDLLQREGHKYDYCYDWTILKQNKCHDNGKIRVEIRTQQTDKKYSFNLEKEKSEKQISNRQEEDKQSPIHNLNHSKFVRRDQQFQSEQSGSQSESESSRNSKDEEKQNREEEDDDQDFQIGEQNVSDSRVREGEDGYSSKKVNMQFDLQQKKNQLYDSDDQIVI